jgi:hypothetical protein
LAGKDILYGDPNEQEVEVSEYSSDLKQRLDKAFDTVGEQISTQHKRQKRTYDQRQHGKPFKVGHFVWVYNPRYKKGLTKTLGCNWYGPYQVLKRHSDTI